jgi:hypothetical protein
MPNWCENILTIEDCSPELASYLKENGFSFEKIKPTPPELLEGSGWYDWRVSNWGTKWDLDEPEQKDVAAHLDLLMSSGSRLSVAFMTAWAAPCQAIAALSKKFPNDEFVLRYVEFGMGFAGTAYISNGMSHEEDTDDNDEINQFAVDYFGYDMEELTEGED